MLARFPVYRCLFLIVFRLFFSVSLIDQSPLLAALRNRSRTQAAED
jgi:hypothetical protein